MSNYPYADRFAIHRSLPERGMSREEVLSQLRTMATEEDAFWETRQVLGHHVLRRPRPLRLHERGLRPLRPRERPAARHVPERDQVRGGDHRHDARPARTGRGGGSAGDDPCGLVTTGGTGSILHAMLAYREHAAQTRGITRPNVIKPETAPPRLRQGVPSLRGRAAAGPGRTRSRRRSTWTGCATTSTSRHGRARSARPATTATAPSTRSATCPTSALERGIGLHVDGCLGGFILPFGRGARLRHPGLRLLGSRASRPSRPTPTSTATPSRARRC